MDNRNLPAFSQLWRPIVQGQGCGQGGLLLGALRAVHPSSPCGGDNPGCLWASGCAPTLSAPLSSHGLPHHKGTYWVEGPSDSVGVRLHSEFTAKVLFPNKAQPGPLGLARCHSSHHGCFHHCQSNDFSKSVSVTNFSSVSSENPFIQNTQGL